eukprot:403332147
MHLHLQQNNPPSLSRPSQLLESFNFHQEDLLEDIETHPYGLKLGNATEFNFSQNQREAPLFNTNNKERVIEYDNDLHQQPLNNYNTGVPLLSQFAYHQDRPRSPSNQMQDNMIFGFQHPNQNQFSGSKYQANQQKQLNINNDQLNLNYQNFQILSQGDNFQPNNQLFTNQDFTCKDDDFRMLNQFNQNCQTIENQNNGQKLNDLYILNHDPRKLDQNRVGFYTRPGQQNINQSLNQKVRQQQENFNELNLKQNQQQSLKQGFNKNYQNSGTQNQQKEAYDTYLNSPEKDVNFNQITPKHQRSFQNQCLKQFGQVKQKSQVPSQNLNGFNTGIEQQYNQSLDGLNIYIDDKIDRLKLKIDNLQKELQTLEKISVNPEQIQKLIQAGVVDKSKLGILHTQIIIDAEQSLNENIIKVNAIHKKFMGIETIEEKPLPQSNKLQLRTRSINLNSNQNLIKQELSHGNAQHNSLERQSNKNFQIESQNTDKSSEIIFNNQANEKKAVPDLQIKPENKIQIKEQKQSSNLFNQNVKMKNEYAISDQDYKYAQAQINQNKLQHHQNQTKPQQNLESDPLGIMNICRLIKRNPQDLMQNLNYRPPQTNLLKNQRVQVPASNQGHGTLNHLVLAKFNHQNLAKQTQNHLQNQSEYKLGLMHHTYHGSGINKHKKTLDMRADDSKSIISNRKRSKYKMLEPNLKQRAVQMALEKNPKYASQHCMVPLKSLKRWMKVGWQRKKGGGRKTKDPEMEKRLYNWYKQMKSQNTPITARMIKDKAITLTSCKDFIASKGWLDKFKIRYQLEISKESGTNSGQMGTNGIKRDSNNKQKPPIAPQFFKNRLQMGASKEKNKPSITIQVKNEGHNLHNLEKNYPHTQKIMNSQFKGQEFKILSPHSQAVKDFDENIGSAIKHTTSQFTIYSTNQQPINSKQAQNQQRKHVLKVGGVTTQFLQDKDDKLLIKTIEKAKRFESIDLYENIDMNKFTNMTPNKQSLLNINQQQWGNGNFVNMKQFQKANQRRVQTSMKQHMYSDQKPKLDHKSLYPYISNTASQKTVKFQIGNQLSNQKVDVKSYARTLLFENTPFMENPSQSKSVTNQEAKSSQIKQKMLTNNNYSSMLSSMQKKRKFDQLQNRFQQTINLLPDDARKQMIQMSEAINIQENTDEQEKGFHQNFNSDQNPNHLYDLYSHNNLANQTPKTLTGHLKQQISMKKALNRQHIRSMFQLINQNFKRKSFRRIS